MSEQNKELLEENKIIDSMSDHLFDLVFNGITFDALLYFVTDKVAQYRIMHARSATKHFVLYCMNIELFCRSSQGKRTVLWESCVMMAVFSLILWFHHIPYVFLVMIFCTLLTILKLQDGDGDSRPDDWISNYIYHLSDTVKVLITKLTNMINSCKSTKLIRYEPIISKHVSNYENPNSLQTQPSIFTSWAGGPARRILIEKYDTDSKFKNVQPRGLINEGNLCFFNSVIQVLARLNYFAVEIEESLINRDAKEPVLHEVVNVFSDLLSIESENPVSTFHLRKALYLDFQRYHRGNCLIKPNKTKQDEEDVAEFLTWLLNLLHNSLNRVKKIKNRRTYDRTHNDGENIWRMYDCPRYEKIKSLKQFHLQELNKSFKTRSNEWGSQHAGRIADLDWIKQIWHSHEDHTITDIFAGQSFEMEVCPEHNKASVKTDLFMILHAPIPRDFSTLEDLLDDLSSPERVNNSGNDLSCPICCHGRRSRASASSPISNRAPPSIHNHFPSDILSPIRREEVDAKFSDDVASRSLKLTFINKLPECLVIQLMRFNVQSDDPYGGIKAKKTLKLQHKVKCGLHLDMSPYRPKGGHRDSSHYFLHAAILHHSSSITEGHYRAVVKTSRNTWHLFDDEKAYQIEDMEQFLDRSSVKENIYLLFYSKHHSRS